MNRRAESQQRYRDKNREKLNEKHRIYHAKNREKRALQCRLWREANRAYLVEYRKKKALLDSPCILGCGRATLSVSGVCMPCQKKQSDAFKPALKAIQIERKTL